MTEENKKNEEIEEIEEIDTEEEDDGTRDELKEIIREVIAEMNPAKITSEVDDSKPLRRADIEEVIKREMTEAMKVLQAKKTTKPVKKSAPAVEPEAVPAPPVKKYDLKKMLWGE